MFVIFSDSFVGLVSLRRDSDCCFLRPWWEPPNSLSPSPIMMVSDPRSQCTPSDPGVVLCVEGCVTPHLSTPSVCVDNCPYGCFRFYLSPLMDRKGEEGESRKQQRTTDLGWPSVYYVFGPCTFDLLNERTVRGTSLVPCLDPKSNSHELFIYDLLILV